jgi:AraC family transcriptional activator of pobA
MAETAPGVDKYPYDFVLEKYRQIYKKYLDDGIIDLDKRMKHRFTFQLYPLETAIPRINGTIPPSRQTPYWIVLVKKGSGEKSIGMHTFPITENTLFIVPKRVTHSSTYFSLDCSGYLLAFSIDFFLNNAFPKNLILNRKVLKNSTRPYLYLNEAQSKVLMEIFEFLQRENFLTDQAKNEMIAIKILELLITCDRFFTDAELTGQEPIYHPVVERFAELLEQNYSKERNVGFYAATLYLHPNSLNLLLKKYTGKSAKQNIIDRVVTEARFLLAAKELNVQQIAYQLGFTEPNNFSAFFLKHTGTNPAALQAVPKSAPIRSC